MNSSFVILTLLAMACGVRGEDSPFPIPRTHTATGPSAGQEPWVTDGESFTYALYLKQGLLTVRAGTASLNVTKKGNSYEAVLEFRAASVVDMVYHLAVRMSTRLTPDLKPIVYVKHAEEGSSVYDETIEFSTPAEGGCMVSARRVFKDGKTDTGVVSRPAQVFDLVSLIFYARRLDVENLKPGTRIDLPVASGVKVTDQSLEYAGMEEVETARGKVNACVFNLVSGPKVQTARLAFSPDGNRIPQRIDVALKFGFVSARLM